MIWAFLMNNPIARGLAKIGALVLAVLTFGEYQRRKGIALQKQKSSMEASRAHAETVKEVLNETPSDDPVADLRQRMRDRAER